MAEKKYIELQKALNVCEMHYEHCLEMHDWSGDATADNIKRDIETIPTADVVEVKHGEWKHKRATIDGEHYFCCSKCGREVSVNMYDNPSVTKFYPYCHCGAKMDGRSDV